MRIRVETSVDENLVTMDVEEIVNQLGSIEGN
jgi:hypothetical protein